VISTGVFEFSREIEKSRAGIIITYGQPEALVRAVNSIMNSYASYRKNALHLAGKYRWDLIYPKLFNNLFPNKH